ncbi:MAG: Gfo/Idh/MocA family oxidoreductase [Planctomycetes bacterium]|nr:Gfo/Idh/MocA family oxidoreductase [Planctomycetota bacterium]
MAWHQFGRNANLVAICDVDLREAERAAATIEEKIGVRPEIYQDYRKLLERSDIEVVGNATPDHWHTKINIDACRAGKDVYAEKPLTFTIDEGKQLRKVVHQTGRILQVGSQQRSGAEFRTACELVRNGRIGRLRRVGVLLPFNSDCRGGPFASQAVPSELNWDLWQGQAAEHAFSPQRLAFRRWHEYAAGMITDWGHHHFDIAHWGMAMDETGPLSVDAKGYLFNVGKPDCFNNIDVFAAHLKYPGDIDLWCMTVRDEKYLESLAAGYPTREADTSIYADVPDEIKQEKRNGVMFIGDSGRIFVNRGGLYGAAVDELKENPLPSNAERLYVSNDHMENLIECMKTRRQPICSVDIGHRSVTPCHLVNISMRLQREILWDPMKEEVVGDDEANGWLVREQRPPYTIA